MSAGRARSASYVILSIAPFVIIPLAGARALRMPGIHQTVGVVLFAILCVAVTSLFLCAADRLRAVAGALFVAPFALVALLWVGLGTPWDATPAENVMRYSVLLVGSVCVTTAFLLLKEALRDHGERLYSALGFSAAMLAGAAYVVWMSYELGAHAARLHGTLSESITSLADVLDTLLFAACALTYLATAAFAGSMGRAGWLGRIACRVYVGLNLLLLAFLMIRGLSFPDPRASTTPWYLRPGFVAGIPAVPWVMPFLLGVVCLAMAAGEVDREEQERSVNTATARVN